MRWSVGNTAASHFAGWVLLAALGASASATPARQPQGAGELCLAAITVAETVHRLPAHLLRSIAFVESGRPDPVTGRAVPWPWTINAGGRGSFFATREEAVAAVRMLQAAGVRSIDVGCAQVNLMHHPRAFASLEDAFDPQVNAAYAARFLVALQASTRNWPLAAAAYHSQTPDLGIGYARRVMAIWPNSASYGVLPDVVGTGSTTRAAVADYTRYTPAFAAALRRMDQDRTGPARPSDTRSVWINRPPAPVPISSSGSREVARREARRGAG